jgi:hypothetical protein
LIDVKSLPRTFHAAIDAHQGGASCTPYDAMVAVAQTGVAGTEREFPPLHHGISSWIHGGWPYRTRALLCRAHTFGDVARMAQLQPHAHVRTLTSERYSPLGQIDRNNVTNTNGFHVIVTGARIDAPHSDWDIQLLRCCENTKDGRRKTP